MRHAWLVATLFASLLFTLTAAAQNLDRESTDGSAAADRLATARSRYLQHENVAAASDETAADNSDNLTLAQLSRRRPVPRFPQRGRAPRPRPARARVWMGPGNGRGALIGAAIGFGLGAAAGAHANTDQHPGAGVKAAVLVGGIGAMFGALIGGSMPVFHSQNGRRPLERDEENEDAAGPKPDFKPASNQTDSPPAASLPTPSTSSGQALAKNARMGHPRFSSQF
jgi:hypothetical protein